MPSSSDDLPPIPDARPDWLPLWVWAEVHQMRAEHESADGDGAVHLPKALPEQRPSWLPEVLWAELRRLRRDYGRTVVL